MQYTTVQGDTFDLIAKHSYGSEMLMNQIVVANQEHMDTLVFSAGVVLTVPDLPAEQLEVNTIPPWRRGSL